VTAFTWIGRGTQDVSPTFLTSTDEQAATIVPVLVAVVLLTLLGRERRGLALGTDQASAVPVVTTAGSG
jgi:hypothetical protein